MSQFGSLAFLGVLVAVGSVMPATGAVIMDAATNNGSFETPDVPNDYDSAAIPGWNHPGGNSNFQIRQPGYMDGASDGAQSMHIVNLAGWYSNVLTTTPLVAGETVTMSVDTGWDSWVNQTPSAGSTYYLYAVDPTNNANQFQILTFTGVADYNGFGSDAGWNTDSASALVQGAWNGFHTQVVIASGGNANNMVDNFVITMTPEPSAIGLLAVGGVTLLARGRRGQR